MNQITTIGIDLAKNVFQVARFQSNQSLVSNHAMSRAKLITLLSNTPPCTIGMEAGGSAHYFANLFSSYGHTVKLLPPVFVKGFLYGNKHDVNDAKAIGLAAMQVQAPLVQPKTEHQLQLQALLRIRERRVQQHTACSNQIRSLLTEHGIILRNGHTHLRRFDPSSLPQGLQHITQDLLDEFRQLDKQLKYSDQTIEQTVNQHQIGKALLTIPGFGKLNALAALVIQPADFNNGRHYSAYLGLTPRLSGNGGKINIHGISKRGNRYHRQLLCHDARAFLHLNKNANDPLWKWAKNIQQKKNTNIAVVALANKLARISWRVMNGDTYDPKKAVN